MTMDKNGKGAKREVELRQGRGRPKGSGKTQDIATLRAMAALIAETPGLKPTTAHKRVVKRPDETAVRRIQGKWKLQGGALLAEARKDRAARAAATASGSIPTAGSSGGLPFGMMEQIRAAQALHNDPAVKQARELQNDPAVRAALKLAGDPTFRMMQEMAKSPAMQAIRDMKRLGLIR